MTSHASLLAAFAHLPIQPTEEQLLFLGCPAVMGPPLSTAAFIRMNEELRWIMEGMRAAKLRALVALYHKLDVDDNKFVTCGEVMGQFAFSERDVALPQLYACTGRMPPDEPFPEHVTLPEFQALYAPVMALRSR